MSFLPSAGGGILTSLKGTWRSGCQLKIRCKFLTPLKHGSPTFVFKFWQVFWKQLEYRRKRDSLVLKGNGERVIVDVFDKALQDRRTHRRGVSTSEHDSWRKWSATYLSCTDCTGQKGKSWLWVFKQVLSFVEDIKILRREHDRHMVFIYRSSITNLSTATRNAH